MVGAGNIGKPKKSPTNNLKELNDEALNCGY